MLGSMPLMFCEIKELECVHPKTIVISGSFYDHKCNQITRSYDFFLRIAYSKMPKNMQFHFKMQARKMINPLTKMQKLSNYEHIQTRKYSESTQISKPTTHQK